LPPASNRDRAEAANFSKRDLQKRQVDKVRCPPFVGCERELGAGFEEQQSPTPRYTACTDGRLDNNRVSPAACDAEFLWADPIVYRDAVVRRKIAIRL
jgi:hypothetical protein